MSYLLIIRITHKYVEGYIRVKENSQIKLHIYRLRITNAEYPIDGEYI